MSFDVTNPAKPKIVKDPNAVLDYAFDWTAWMTDDDTIVDVDVSVTGGVVVDSTVIVSDLAIEADPDAMPDPILAVPASHITTAVISGGTAGTPATATFRITTADGRIEDRTMYFQVKER